MSGEITGISLAIVCPPRPVGQWTDISNFRQFKSRTLAEGTHWIWGNGSSNQCRKHLWQEIRTCLDFAILGRFNQAQPGNMPFRTSRNQVLRLFTDSYTPADFSEQLTEVSIHEGGRAEVTGFPTRGLPW